MLFDSIQGDFSLVFRVGCALAKANVISLFIWPFLHSAVLRWICTSFLKFIIWRGSHFPISKFLERVKETSFPPPCCCCLVTKSCPTLLRPHGLQPSRFLCPWDFPGRNTAVGCHFLLQGILPTQGSNPLSHRGSPWYCAESKIGLLKLLTLT